MASLPLSADSKIELETQHLCCLVYKNPQTRAQRENSNLRHKTIAIKTSCQIKLWKHSLNLLGRWLKLGGGVFEGGNSGYTHFWFGPGIKSQVLDLKTLAIFSPLKISVNPWQTKENLRSYTDDIIILLKFIFTGLQGYQIRPGLSTNKQRHSLLLLKTGIHAAPTHL